jgi:multiple sugar transport system ATP-binding protein
MSTARLDHVSKQYDGHLAVDGIELDIADGEFVVFVGPSGCGKSTTLRMIAGLERATGGEIWIDGKRANHVSPRDRDIAMVFQNYALYPHMTVAQNLSYALRLRRRSQADIDRRVDEVAKSLDLMPLLKRKPSQLSGGQRQRVALGRAIIREPKLFLMDEPLSNLDAKLRVQTRAEITRLQRALGVTTIYVTHDQTEAMTMGSKIVVMNGGRIQQADTPQRLYQYPANTFVAQFIGTPPMNLLRCRLQDEDGVVTAIGQGVQLPIPEADRAALQAGAGRDEFLIGFRPEDIVIAPGAGADGVGGTADVVEGLGHESLVSITNGANSFIARMTPDAAAPIMLGETLAFAVNPDRLRYFSVDTGKAIASTRPHS